MKKFRTRKIAAVAARRSHKVSTAPLNEYMQEVIDAYPPPAYKGKYIRIKYITQLKTTTPTFVFFCNPVKEICLALF